MPSIPIDISNLIIDELHNDNLALKTCSLVCRSFVPSCRMHLFSKIFVSGLTKELLLKSLNNLRALLSTRPALADNVRRLSFHPYMAEFEQEWIMFEEDLPHLLLQLHRLQSFSLSFGRTDSEWGLVVPSALQSALFDIFRRPTLTSLSLSYMRNFPIYMLSSCPNLEALSLYSVYSDLGNMDFAPLPLGVGDTRPKGHLKQLDLATSLSVTQLLLRVLAHPQSLLKITRLQELVASPETRGDVDAYWEVMKATSGSLEAFQWFPRAMGFTPSIPESLDIGILSELRTIRYYIQIGIEGGSESFSAFLRFLQKATAENKISSLMITTSSNSIYDLGRARREPIGQCCGWTELDSILACPNFARLKLLFFHVFVFNDVKHGEPVPNPSDSGVVVDYFPLVLAKGVEIRVQYIHL